MTSNVGKGKNIDLRSVIDEHASRSIGMMCYNKKEIEKIFMFHIREYFSKVKLSKAHKDKNCTSMLENSTRENILKVELNREDCDEESTHEFLCFFEKKENNTSR